MSDKLYHHIIDKIDFDDDFIKVHKKRTGSSFSSSDIALVRRMTPEAFDGLVRKGFGVPMAEFKCFQSNIKEFDHALFEILYDQASITVDNIEDKILIPALNTFDYVDSDSFKYQALNHYWNNCLDRQLVCKITDREFNNFYDVNAWCQHMNTKLTDVVLEPVPEENPFIDIQPKGSSYWYLKLSHRNGRISYAICGFSYNFICYK